MEQKLFSKTWIAVFAALTAIGIGFWIYQLINGLQVTGMGNTNSWGIYIIMFMFFVGLSAGGLIVASSGHVFNIEKFKKVALPAVICSTVCIVLAALFVLVDLGGFVRVWRLLTNPNFASPLMWDVAVITIYLVLNILDIIWMRKGDEKKVKVLSCIALPTAIMVHTVTAWIFGLQIGRTWYTAVMGPIFVASAMDSGLALLLLALLLLEARNLFQTGKTLFKSLAGLLATFIAVDFYLIICELLTMGYPEAGDAAAFAVMTSGATAPYFWFEMICGILIPFIILVIPKNREKKSMIILASVLVVLGVFCKRVWLLLTAFAAPYLAGNATLTDAFATAAGTFGGIGALYSPTLVEILIVLGVLSLGVLAFMLLSNKLLGKK